MTKKMNDTMMNNAMTKSEEELEAIIETVVRNTLKNYPTLTRSDFTENVFLTAFSAHIFGKDYPKEYEDKLYKVSLIAFQRIIARLSN